LWGGRGGGQKKKKGGGGGGPGDGLPGGAINTPKEKKIKQKKVCPREKHTNTGIFGKVRAGSAV